jgi:DNA-binding beta-propeller fold protein YncE
MTISFAIRRTAVLRGALFLFLATMMISQGQAQGVNASIPVAGIDGAAKGTPPFSISTFYTGIEPIAVAVNPVTNTAYIANFASGTVKVLHQAKGMPRRTR